jgi:hypothetical protein
VADPNVLPGLEVRYITDPAEIARLQAETVAFDAEAGYAQPLLTTPQPGVCKRCADAGEATCVFGPSHTLMGPRRFRDADGKAHVHDSNTFGATYACKAGHRWNQRWTLPCWCGWQSDHTFREPYEELPDAC